MGGGEGGARAEAGVFAASFISVDGIFPTAESFGSAHLENYG